MKIFRTFALVALCTGFLLSATSCAVMVQRDSGKQKGWYKNPKNPHHPDSTSPGKSRGKSKK